MKSCRSVVRVPRDLAGWVIGTNRAHLNEVEEELAVLAFPVEVPSAQSVDVHILSCNVETRRHGAMGSFGSGAMSRT